MAKQVIVMRKDLKVHKGKYVSQGSHGSLGVVLKMMNNGKTLKEKMPEIIDGKYRLTLEVEVGSDLDDWLRGIFRKITLSVDSEEELLEIHQKALDANIPVQMVTDMGLTEFNGVPTNTCVVLGPYNSDEIDKITGHLKLF